jgi:hypothetical protein
METNVVYQTLLCAWFLGLLRSPTRAVRRFDKPAHHKNALA